MKRNLLVLTMAFCMILGTMSLFVMADETQNNDMVVIFEENFDEYEAGVDVKNTKMPNFFFTEAQSIGNGSILVKEDHNGNLYLESRVFTQIYTKAPIEGAHVFSVDVSESQGTTQTGFYVRAPKNASAFYEGDGDADNSISLSGLMIYTKNDRLGVNVKSFDTSSPKSVKNNTEWFALPAGAAMGNNESYNLRVEDNGVDEVKIYVNDTLMCRVTMANGGSTYGDLGIAEPCFDNVTLYDAAENEKASYTKTLVMAEGSRIGWATRVAVMSVDSVKIMGSADISSPKPPQSLPQKPLPRLLPKP